jgi:hypothetical protein
MRMIAAQFEGKEKEEEQSELSASDSEEIGRGLLRKIRDLMDLIKV